MKSLEEQYYSYIDNKMSNKLKKADKLCDKLKIDKNDFFIFFIQQIKNGSAEIIEDIYEILYWYISEKVDDFLEEQGIKLKYTFFDYDGNEFFVNDESNKEFRNKIIKLDLEKKKELMKNVLFSYAIKNSKQKIFSKKEKIILSRTEKLKKIEELNN